MVTEKEDANVTPDKTDWDGLITWLTDQEHVSSETAVSRKPFNPDIIIGEDKEKTMDFNVAGLIGGVVVAIIVFALYRMGFRGHGGD